MRDKFLSVRFDRPLTSSFALFDTTHTEPSSSSTFSLRDEICARLWARVILIGNWTFFSSSPTICTQNVRHLRGAEAIRDQRIPRFLAFLSCQCSNLQKFLVFLWPGKWKSNSMLIKALLCVASSPSEQIISSFLSFILVSLPFSRCSHAHTEWREERTIHNLQLSSLLLKTSSLFSSFFCQMNEEEIKRLRNIWDWARAISTICPSCWATYTQCLPHCHWLLLG